MTKEEKKKWFQRYQKEHLEQFREYNKKSYHKHRERLKPIRRVQRLKWKYGMSEEQYNQLLIKQDHKCAICKRPLVGKIDVDHNHKTNKNRGLLCGKCNKAIGLLDENIILLASAITYLKEYDNEKTDDKETSRQN